MQKDLAVNSHRGHFSKYWIYWLLIHVEAFIIVLYSIFVQYGRNGSPKHADNYKYLTDTHIVDSWHIFQDVNVMIFIGFGFIVAYLKKFSWSGIAINFGLAAWTIQMAVLTQGWWYAIFTGDWDSKISLTILNLMEAEYTAGAVIVAVGAVFGKLNLAQYVVMASVVAVFQPLVWRVTNITFVANDHGGAMNVFLFGAVFGLGVSMIFKKGNLDDSRNYISRTSGVFALLGTLFLWIYWPSWNAAFVTGNQRLRAHMNTILSLTGSCITTFFASTFLTNGKFSIKHILYGTISGGVMMGSIADSLVLPWISFFLGCFSGAVTVFGIYYVTPLMNNSKIQDNLGVLFVYGIPGFLSGIVSACIAGTASMAYYGKEDIYKVFPLWDTRSRNYIAGYQLAVIIVVVSYALVVGLFTGALLNYSCFENIVNLFDDGEIFNTGAVVKEYVDVIKDNRNLEITQFKPPSKLIKNEDKDSERENLKEELHISTPSNIPVRERKVNKQEVSEVSEEKELKDSREEVLELTEVNKQKEVKEAIEINEIKEEKEKPVEIRHLEIYLEAFD
jgi:ammonium transporter Rh